MYQKTVVLGHVGRDAEMRYTQTGKAVAEFSVAVNIGYGDNKKTQWWSVTAWEKLAETCNQYVKTGMLVLVEGHAEMQEWEDKEGQHKSKLIIVARDVRFLSKAESSQEPVQDNFPFD